MKFTKAQEVTIFLLFHQINLVNHGQVAERFNKKIEGTRGDFQSYKSQRKKSLSKLKWAIKLSLF